MLGEAVVVEDGKPEGLVEGVGVGQVLELELREEEYTVLNFPAKTTSEFWEKADYS